MTHEEAPVLPEGGRLLHIGPHKTGSTTLQVAFHQNRPALAEQGVHYAGKNEQPMKAAMVASMGPDLASLSEAARGAWDRLIEELDGTTAPRVMISSEFFCEAGDDRIGVILDRLGRDRTHVVVTLRPLSRIMASQWQQYMQNRMLISYDDWLEAMLHHPEQQKVTPSFWRRHRHDELVTRWAEVAGRENLTVVVVDESAPQMLVRTFERMLSLAPGTVEPRNVSANRSLTFPEVEFMRAFNATFRTTGWSEEDYTRFVRFGAVRHLQTRTPGPGEPRVLTPPWAAQRVAEIEHEMVEVIGASGVRVVGDLSSLTAPVAPDAIGENQPLTGVPVEIAARFAAGMVKHYQNIPPRTADPKRSPGPLEVTLRRRREAIRLSRELRKATD